MKRRYTTEAELVHAIDRRLALAKFWQEQAERLDRQADGLFKLVGSRRIRLRPDDCALLLKGRARGKRHLALVCRRNATMNDTRAQTMGLALATLRTPMLGADFGDQSVTT